MQVWNVLHAARWNTGRKESQKIRQLRTIAQFCWAVSLQLRHVSTIGKIVKQQYLLHTFSQYGELRSISGSDRFTSLGHRSKFQRVSRVGFVTVRRRRSPRPTTLCTMFDYLLRWYTIYIYTFSRAIALWLTEFCQVQNSLYVKVLRSPILAALLHGTPAKLCGVVQEMELLKFRRGRHLYSAGRPSRWESAHILVNASIYGYRGLREMCATIRVTSDDWNVPYAVLAHYFLSLRTYGTLRIFYKTYEYACASSNAQKCDASITLAYTPMGLGRI